MSKEVEKIIVEESPKAETSGECTGSFREVPAKPKVLKYYKYFSKVLFFFFTFYSFILAKMFCFINYSLQLFSLIIGSNTSGDCKNRAI